MKFNIKNLVKLFRRKTSDKAVSEPNRKPAPKPKEIINRIEIILRTGDKIIFDDTDETNIGKPDKAFLAFLNWFENPKSKKYYLFYFNKGLRMILKSEIFTFLIYAVKEQNENKT